MSFHWRGVEVRLGASSGVDLVTAQNYEILNPFRVSSVPLGIPPKAHVLLWCNSERLRRNENISASTTYSEAPRIANQKIVSTDNV
ncbi:hypothetical protein TNCV_1551081 [Trichonephila clavipes]|nr:hypothetical protein TNCV_1551081 [Trichonephila clavipes]